MSLGVDININAAPPTRAAPAPTGRWMVAATSATGTAMEPALVRSPAELAAAFGARDTANRILYDAAELYFRSGGAEMVVVRLGASTVERTLALYQEALATLDASWGPGQVSILGEIGDAHTALLAHQAATGRIAILDEEVDTTSVERLAMIAALKSVSGSKGAQVFGPWETIPSPTTAGATVTVPASAHVAGRINAMDTAAGHAGRAPIAEQGQIPPAGAAPYALGLAQQLTAAEQQAAFDAGFGLITVPAGTRVPTLQSFLALTDDPAYAQLTVARMAMDLDRRFDAIGVQFRGRGATRPVLKEFKGALEGELLRLVGVDGPVYETGDPLRPPYVVDVGPTVNPDEVIATGQGVAAVTVRLAPYLHTITINATIRIAGS